jgi:hypothetical protein
VDLSGSEMLATAIKGRMLLPNAFVSLNRSTGAMTGHRKAALCSALPKCKGFVAQQAVRKTS